MHTVTPPRRKPATNIVLGEGQRERLEAFVRFRRPLVAIIREAVDEWLHRNEGRQRRRGEED